MNARRSKINILVDILRLVQRKDGRAKPTHILYGANLSHARLKKYLDLLLMNEFIEKMDRGNHVFYRITLKGQKFISEFKKVEELSKAFGVPI